ncbi:AAA domain-containing protein [Thioalkalivibrio sp.]|uniref:AAA domain-containing protein n=1 Tax=Thioalkalivibrio sp. TaxID=2093813 RepID=UPI0039763413
MNAETGETVTASDRDPGAEGGQRAHSDRDVPWLQIVRLHREVAVRGHWSFGRIHGQHGQAADWTSLEAFEPVDLGGPWPLPTACICSDALRKVLDANGDASLFLGGPCLPDWVDDDDAPAPYWRPLFYREVRLHRLGDGFDMVPRQPAWSLNAQFGGLIERLELHPEGGLEALAEGLLREAEGQRRPQSPPLDQRILEALGRLLPGIAELLAALRPGADGGNRPGPWVLFAVNAADAGGASPRVREYLQLEDLLREDPSTPGGLRLLEDRPAEGCPAEETIRALLPLGRAQRQAVERVLRGERLSVIDGPAGSGKSQVLVSLLLNAWIRGRSALLVSEGDRAVDLIRERLQRFETGFPIAVRAGGHSWPAVAEALRRVRENTDADESGCAANAAGLLQQQQALREEAARLRAALESGLPDRIEASGGAVLAAYAGSQATRDRLSEDAAALVDEQSALGLAAFAPDRVDQALAATREWLQRMAHYQDLARQDDQRRSDLEGEIGECRRGRDQALAEAGATVPDGADCDWLLEDPGPELLRDWEEGSAAFLREPLEVALAEHEWPEAYDRWPSLEASEDWAGRARSLAAQARSFSRELSSPEQEGEQERVQGLDTALEKQRVKLRGLGLPEGFDANTGPIKDWLATQSLLQGLARDRMDFLPWSPRARLQRRLRRIERHLLPSLPAAVLISVGVMDERGRSRLMTVLEAAQRWAQLSSERDQWQRSARPLADRSADLRREAAALGLLTAPEALDPDVWTEWAARHEQEAMLAERAAEAWRSRAKKEKAQASLRRVAADWVDLVADLPLVHSWCRGPGQAFDAAVRALAGEPDMLGVVTARNALSSGALTGLRQCWERAAERERSARRLVGELQEIPTPADRIRDWRKESVGRGLLDLDDGDGWLDQDDALARLDRVADWCVRWQLFQQEDRPLALRRAEGQLDTAISGLEASLRMLPPGAARERLQDLVDAIREDPGREWPESALRDAYAAFQPDALQARIESIESELDQRALAYASAERRERLRTDSGLSDAVRALRQAVDQADGHAGLLPHSDFRTLLSVLPIWIATADDVGVLPLEAGLFDMVVIDEAPQCTLTSMLPAIYRGRTLVVAGDRGSLPAVHGVPAGEERALGTRLQVEAWLGDLGHSGNDVHRTVTEVLNRREDPPVMLDTVYRSHPEIVALANRCVYRRRLLLPEAPSGWDGSSHRQGLHAIAVAGLACPGTGGRSWINEPEATRAVELIRDLLGESDDLGIALISPFAAQRELLRERLDALGIAPNLLIGAPEALQGDERDVIVFSPVVSRGMPAMARRWVDSPPNRLNLALTRARRTLFVLAEFDHCLEQDGALREVARHCREVQCLRARGPAPLELFTWMLLQGWAPTVRPRIGDLEVDLVWEPSPEHHLAIEVDAGASRLDMERDKAREAYLYWMGYERVRIEAEAVMEDPRGVIAEILGRQGRSH